MIFPTLFAAWGPKKGDEMESCGRSQIKRPNRNEEGHILCSMPGRFGDILWALPTVRAISEYHGKPVSFVTSSRFRSIVDLIQHQDYIDQAFVDPCWTIAEEAPITPREPVTRYDAYDWHYILGYPDWPTFPLPFYVKSYGCPERDIRIGDPWITPPIVTRGSKRIAVGFPDEWIELKMGVLLNLAGEFDQVQFDLLVPDRIGSRIREWTDVLPANVAILPCSWPVAAHFIATSGLYLGCLSALWVLANAVGTPTVIFEPSDQRHHPIFWVDRYDDHNKNQNHLVRGIDGKPTFDARHVMSDLDDALTPIWHKEVADGETNEPDGR